MTEDYQARDRNLPARYVIGQDADGTPQGYALFNIGDYRNLDPAQQEAYVNELVRFATATGGAGNITDKIRVIADAALSNPNYAGNQGYEQYHFAVVNTEYSLVDFLIKDTDFSRDYRDVNTETLRDIYSFDFSERQNEVFTNWLAHHEGSHALGLSEAGADFFGAAKALQINPDGAETLQFIADTRMMHTLFFDPVRLGEDSEGFFQNYRYGYKTSQAIEQVLDMPAEQLASMSDQDLLREASSFEARMQSLTNAGATEFAVHQALWNYNPQNSEYPVGTEIMRSGDMNAIRNLAQRVLETSGFVAGSHEEQLLKDFIGTMNRRTGIECQNTRESELSVQPNGLDVSRQYSLNR